MPNRKVNKRLQYGICIVSALLGLVTFHASSWAGSKSSCENCHLDEEMLTATLKTDSTAKSALQSGSG